jgi:hypothetical protein
MKERPLRETSAGALIIAKDGVRKALPYPFSLEGAGDIKIRAKEDAKAFSHGAFVTGDGRVDSRKIKVGLYIRSESEAEHDQAMNLIYSAFNQESYTLTAGRPDRVYNVARLAEIKHKYIKGFRQRRSDIDISLLLADPFRYAAQSSRLLAALPGEAAVVKVHNPGSADTPLAITLIPAVSMPDVTIHHLETGYTCRIRDSLLTNPAALTADTQKGTVRRGEWNAINAFSGQFMIALPGLNRYEVTSAAGGMEVVFTARWLI